MGTRSNTLVVDDGTIVVNLYRQFDGYPSGHGKELAEFLKDLKLCNGIGAQQEQGRWANGLGCLAAQLVAHFKKEIGSFYLNDPMEKLDNDYTYWIYGSSFEDYGLKVKVNCFDETIFEGSVEDFTSFCDSE